MKETLWYRCGMCSPDQSRSFDVEPNDPPLSVAYFLAAKEHARVSPDCPAARNPGAVVEVMLVRIVQ